MASQFKHLFSPLRMGSFTAPNRIACLPHGTYFDDRGLPSERSIAYYRTKAKGGTGLIIHEAVTTHPASYGNVFASKEVAPRFKKLTDAVHEYDTRIVVQLAHAGAQMQATFDTPWAPSVVPSPRTWFPPHEMTVAEIKEVVRSFADATVKSREAGFDGVEIQAAHGYLFTEFMSPFSNRRTDDYGGSLENRMRFTLETIEEVRKAVGGDWTLGVRISGDEMMEGGLTLDDMLVIAPFLVEQGRADYLSVSLGTYRSPSTMIDPMYYPLGSAVYCGAAVKTVVQAPVISRGRIQDPVQAEEILSNSQADMVGMGRALIADPEWPNKAREGRLDDIRKCLGCNECAARILYYAPMSLRCTTNATTGMETQPGWLEVTPAAKPKKVVVVGGGPSGMEVAEVAARRGHKVSLYDKSAELGGTALVAARAPGRDGLLEAVRYRAHLVQLLGIEVHLGAEMGAEDIVKLAPDALVMATGSAPIIPDALGVERAVEARDVLSGKAETGQNVVVIAGEHHIQALSVADFLAGQGKRVYLVCEEYYSGMHLDHLTRHAIYQRLYRQGVVFIPNSAVKEIKDNAVVIVNVMTREAHILENIDTAVYACGGRENNALYHDLQGKVKEIYAAGDCSGVKKLIDAIRSGAIVGRKV
ncbi:MAG: FAD-dependent oxidoreductase [Dehalococcoidia bacterium]|nr:FAD-dependent oxidoreductase [Dehalococcoidia bacterium]